jgi:hypothetical protein
VTTMGWQPLLLARGSIILRQLCATKVLRGVQQSLFQHLLAPHCCRFL